LPLWSFQGASGTALSRAVLQNSAAVRNIEVDILLGDCLIRTSRSSSCESIVSRRARQTEPLE
jgi:hypothetical protein